MANSYSFNQISTILNNIVADAHGRTADISTTPRDTYEFVTMAQSAITAGLDPIMNSLTQMINKTIFSVRSYTRKFRVLDSSDLEFGNQIRKVTPIFTDGAQNAPLYNDQPADGLSTDQWKIKRPKVLQTVFNGAEQWQVQAPTVFMDQLKNAFRGPDELGEFISAQLTEVNNEIEQQHEQLARMTVANFIGAKIYADSTSVIHLITEYNNETGLALDPETVKQPDNYPAFIKWAYARINQISDMMENRGTLWHKNLSNYTIMRHTPKSEQRLLIESGAMRQIEAMALSGIYHNDLLTMPNNVERVLFWQNVNDPTSININAKYLDVDGTTPHHAVNQSNIFAVLFDRNAMGINVFNEGVSMTEINARGLYYNTFHTMVKRYYNDLTENAVVFVLE